MKKRLITFLIVLAIGFANTSVYAQTFSGGTGAIPDVTQTCFNVSVTGIGTIGGTMLLTGVCINLNHTYDGDLTITLFAPDGSSVELSSGNGGAGENYTNTCFSMTAGTNITAGTAPYTGTFIPEGTFASVNTGQNADGTWQLCITDGASGDTGTLLSWDITFSSNAPTVITTCSANFYDSGGSGGSYSNGENYIWTYCPGIPGQVITVDFNTFNVESGTNDDRLTIYNGDDVTAPVLTAGDGLNILANTTVMATAANPSGCLTFEWVSDGAITGSGWDAVVTCMAPCQMVVPVWGGSTPSESGGYIDICLGQQITFGATGSYPENGTAYTQSDPTSTFVWDFGDGTSATGMTVTHTFPDQAGYDVDLVITDSEGCTSTIDIGIRVRTGTTPIFAGTMADDYTLCTGQCTNITGVGTPTEYIVPTGQTLAGTTFLPDGTGVSYVTSLNFDNFSPTAIVQNATDIVDICMNLEHSYIGDLIVTIECPNGQTSELFDGNNASNIMAFMGVPIDVDGDLTQGIGYDYCFSPTAGGTITAAASGTTVPAGTYLPEESFNSLIGCPLNGDWTIHVTDDQASDNGYIFSWGINFNPALYPDFWGYTPAIVSSSWSGDGVSAGNPASACPTSMGSSPYTYSVTDEYGCIWDTVINLTVGPGPPITATATPVSCGGTCDGTASVTLTGAVPNFDFYWEDSSGGSAGTTTNTSTSGNTITALCPDTYYLTVTDGDNCSSFTSVNVANTSAMTLTLNATVENCGSADGTVIASVTNGNANYTWTILPSGTGTTGASTSYTFTNLSENTYFVTVTDGSGCTATGSVAVGGTPMIPASFSYASNQCYNAAGVSVNFTNGSPGATLYEWDFDGNGSIDSNAPNPSYTYNAPGVYNAELIVSNGSCTDNEIVAVTIYDLPILTFTPVDPTCNGLNDGQITANPAAGGAAGSSVFTDYNWSNGGTTASISGLSDGTYTVTVTDNFGCTVVGNTTITEPVVLSLSPAQVDPTCYGAANGEAHIVSISGGVGPTFSYTWSTGATTQDITGLTFGTYTVTMSDDGSTGTCEIIQSYTLTEPLEIILTPSSVNSSCNQSDGSATIAITNGISPISIDWAGDGGVADNMLTYSNVPSGTYPVTVTDNDGCTASITVDVNDDSGPVATLNNSTNNNCFGDCNGTMTVDIAGGLLPYNIDWDSGANTYPASNAQENYSGLCAGNHTFQVTDANGCISSVNVDITEPTQVTLNIVGTDANCGIPGSAEDFPSGGTPPYTYAWSSSGGNGSIENNLTAGIYSSTVTDVFGCTAVESVTITDVGNVSISITGFTDVSCNGGNDGTATVTVTGGTPDYTYQWSSGSPVVSSLTSNTVTGLSVGSYTITVTDIGLCSDVTSVTITSPTAVAATITATTDATCNGDCDGTAEVTGSGGTPGYTYQWDFAAANQTTQTATALCDGSYTVTISDLLSCTAVATATINEPNVLAITTDVSTAHCGQADGSAWITGITGGNGGPYTYLWACSGLPLDSVSGILPGVCGVTVTDFYGCAATASVTVPDDPIGVATITNIIDVSCFGASDGSAAVSYSGTVSTYAWSNTQTTQTATGLSGGPFDVTITDIYGCTVVVGGTIQEPSQLTLTFSTSEPSCNGDTDGSISANVTGGTTPYFYQWDNLSTLQEPIVGAGNYCVTVTDDNGCSVLGCDIVTEPPPLSVADSIIDANCGLNDGFVYLTASGGQGNLTIGWSTGDTTQILDSVFAGFYTVTVVDQKNCDFVGSYIVLNNNGPVAVIDQVVDVLCYGDSTGVASVSVTGGAPPYDYTWSNGQTTPLTTNLPAGTHGVMVKDTNSCTQTLTVIIGEPDSLGFFLSTDDPDCYGYSDGSASVNVNGGVTPYTYTWSGTGTAAGSSFNDLGAGGFSILVTDGNNCTVLENFALSEPSQIAFTLIPYDASCPNSGDGQAVVDTVFGGTPSAPGVYTYVWSNNQLTPTASGLDPGTYCLTVSDMNSCEQTACVDILTPSSLQFDNTFSQDLECYNDASGIITVNVSGGTPIYSYVWILDNNVLTDTTASLSGLAEGTYNLSVTDQNGCSITNSILIDQPPPITLNVNDATVACYGDCDATLTADMTGGQPPYSFMWSTFGTDQIEDSICAGNYNLTATDNNGCIEITSAIVDEPPLLEIVNVAVTDATCGNADGIATVTHNGGTVGFVIDWGFSGGDSFTETDLAANSYFVTVSDLNSCSATEWVIVNNIDGPVINSVVSTPVSCYGYADGAASVSYTCSTPVTVVWFNSVNGQIGTGDNITGLPGGSYTVQVTDSNDCNTSYYFDIYEPEVVQSSINTSQDADCFGTCNGWAFASALGGDGNYSYSWSNLDVGIQAQNLCFGNYTLTVSDGQGCTSTSFIFIDEPVQISLSAVVNDVTCFGANNGTINITATGGNGAYNYSWFLPQGNTPIVADLMPVTYYVTVYDQLNAQCYIEDNFTITEPDIIEVFYTTTATYCDGDNGTATITSITGGSGNFTTTWSPPNTSPTATDLAYNSTNILQVSDQIDPQCIISEYISVDRIIPPAVLSQSTTDPTCHDMWDGSAQVEIKDGTAPFYYEWILVSNSLTVSAGYDNSLATGLQAGLYNVEVLDSNGCEVFTSLMLDNPDPVTVYGYGSTTICNGGFAVISASANGGTFPYSYVWGDATITDSAQVQIVYPASSTSYMVSATDVNGCSSTPDLITVVVLPPIDVTIHAAGTEICQGDSVNLTATATGGASPYSFFWNNGSMTASNYASPLVSDTLMVIAYDANFCSAPDTAYQPIIVNPKPYLSMKANLYAGCEPLTVSFHNDTNQTSIYYDWNFGDYNSSYNTSNSQTPSHTFEMSGSFDVTLTLTDLINTCVNQFTFSDMINVYQRPDAAFTMFPGETSLFNAEIQFTDMSTGPVTDWLWSFGDATNSTNPYPLHIYEYADTFTVNMIVSNIITADIVCDDQVSNTIVINPEYTFYAPTAFAPINATSSRENSFWTPKGNGISLEPGTYMLNIYNRWGELIFSADQFYDPGDPNASSEKNRWNGRWNGKGKEFNVGEVVPVGVYTWYVRLIDVTGMEHEESGSVTVIR